MRVSSVLPLVLVANLSACAFISSADYKEKLASLDVDNDGVPAGYPDDPGRDCDDDDPEVNPTLLEVPYDGKDNDCRDGDLVDVDGDGFPGIAFDDWTPVSPSDALPEWPPDVSKAATDVDCLETSLVLRVSDTLQVTVLPENVHPGAAEAWNDGVDADCGRDNDFDRDGDRYIPDEYQDLYAAYVTAWDYGDIASDWWPAGNSAAAFHDCDEDSQGSENIYPGAPNELPYDGVDTNCDGANDFDQDGDGYIPSTCDGGDCASAYAVFRGRYAPQLPATPSTGDCVDAPGSLIVDGDVVNAAEVHPGAAEIYDDGVDADCAGDNDYDADQDGWITSGELAAFQAYLDAWSTYVPPGEAAGTWTYRAAEPEIGDCRDTDANIHPGTLERLADRVDQDCDGGTDLTPAEAVPGVAWADPRELRGGLNGHHMVLVATAAATQDTGVGGAVLAHRGAILRFADDADPGDPLALPPLFWAAEQTASAFTDIGPSFDAIFEPNRFLFGVSQRSESGTRLIGRSLSWDEDFDGLTDRLLSRQAPDNAVWGGIALHQTTGTGTTWAMACRSDGALFSRDQTFLGQESTFDNDLLFDDSDCDGADCTFGDICFIDDASTDAVTGTICGADGCSTWDWTPPRDLALAADQPWATTTLRSAHRHGDTLVLVHTGKGGVTLAAADGAADELENVDVRDADAVWGPDGLLYLGAIIQESGERKAVLYYGAPGSLFRVNLTLPADAVRQPTDIALVDGPSRLLIGVTRSDGVGGNTLDDRVETFLYGWP